MSLVDVDAGDDRGLLGEGAYGEAELGELGDFLGSSQAPEAMDPSWLDGFLCALIGGPVLVPPSVWLPLVWRDSPPAFSSQRQAERILSLLFRHANHVASTLQDGTYLPVLPAEVPEGVNNLAQLWCAGYAEGMLGCQDEWKPFFDDETAAMLFTPIMALGAPDLWDGEAIPEVDLLVTALPAAAVAIAAYWRDPSTRRAPKRTSRAKPPATAAATSVHRLKIQLAGVKPAVWRRVEIPSDAKLPLVSRILLAAMGWTDTHLHAFRVDGITYGVRDPDFADDMRSERSVTLAQIAPQPKSRFVFDYDFGDGWEHRVTVEAIVDARDADAPRCIAGARACPPEDCGGPYGYADLLDVLADPQHEEHAEMREWVGDEFDPSVFDLRSANVGIRALTRRGRRASP